MRSRDDLIAELEAAPTEGRNPRSGGLDRMSSLEICSVMSLEDQIAVEAVRAVLADVAAVVDRIAIAFREGHRLFYAGAGTSGRLGVLDASECPPTFGSSPQQVVALIAGGAEAVFRASEGAEDVEAGGRGVVDEAGVGPGDVLVGIAASGRTPWVGGALDRARELGALGVLLACVPEPALAGRADLVIAVDSGAEVLTGSTRLKAGTATKLVLNMLSTAAMVRTGKVYDNLMVDLRTGSEKLRIRATRMVSRLTGLSWDESVEALDRGDGDVKASVVMVEGRCDLSEARKRLHRAEGRLAVVLDALRGS